MTIEAVGYAEGNGVPDELGGAAEIWRCSDNVCPGDVFNLYGCGLTQETQIFASPLANPGEVLALGVYDVDPDGNYVSTRLPEYAVPGQYTVWASGAGQTNPIVLNAARPQWLENTKCAQGQTVRIFGRNLMPAEFGAEGGPAVRLIGGNGAEYFPEIIDVNPFAVTICPDSTIPAAAYKVEVSNGYGCWQGLEFSESGNSLEIMAPIQDPMGLRVWWGDNFKWDRVISLTAGTHQDITRALQTAIYETHEAGGGVVRIPAGTFRIGSIKIRDNVIIQGAGKEQTFLFYDSPGGSIIQGEYIYGGNIGICDLSISLMNPASDNPYPGSVIWIDGVENTKQIFIKNCGFDMPQLLRWNGGYRENDSSNIEGDLIKTTDDGICMPIYINAGSDIIVERCSIRGYLSGPWINHASTKYVRVSGCSAQTTAGNMHIAGSYAVAENNFLEADPEIENPYDYNSSGIVARGPSYIAGNHIKGMGRSGHNDGEAIFVENAGTIPACAGKVIWAQGSEIQTDPCLYDNEFDMGYSKWGEWHIVITEGKGTGQYRVLTGVRRDGGTAVFQTERAWDIEPDASSRFVVLTPIKGATFYRNEAQDCAKGFWFYHDCIDSVMYENKTIDSSGCLIRSQKNRTISISYFNQLVKNEVRGVSRKSNSAAIGEEAILWVDEDVFCLQSYGTVIQKNTYQGKPEADPVPDVLDCAYIDGIYIGHANRVDRLTGPAVKGGILAKNTIQDSRAGITIGGSLYPRTWFFQNSYLSKGTTGIILEDNSFEHVGTEYVCPYGDDLLQLGDLCQVYRAVATDAVLHSRGKNLFSADIHLKNVSDNTGEFMMLLGAYEGNKLTAAAHSECIRIPIGETGVLKAQIDLTAGWRPGLQVKAFVWSPDMMTVYTTAFTVGEVYDHMAYQHEVVVKGDAGIECANQHIMLLLLDNSAVDLNQVCADDILYMNQSKINPDGTYTMHVPLNKNAGYTVYVNYGRENLSKTVPLPQSAIQVIDFTAGIAG